MRWCDSIHWPAASDQNSSFDSECPSATAVMKAMPRASPISSMARAGTRRWAASGAGGAVVAVAAPAVETWSVSTACALARTAPPRTGSPTRLPYGHPSEAMDKRPSQDGCHRVVSFLPAPGRYAGAVR